MTILLALALVGGAQAAAAAPVTPPQRDVIVTARSLTDTKTALAACIARHCPPDEDVKASLIHAENQFVAGDYRDARQTLLASTHRNRRFARAYPVPVSDLMRASSRVAAHLGETRDYRIDTIDTLDALKDGLPADDPRVVAQRIEVADMFAATGNFDRALEMFGSIRRDAHRLGLASLEGAAILHPAMLLLRGYSSMNFGVTGDRKEAMRALDELADSTDPKMASYALVARVARAQNLAKKGDSRALDAVIAELRARNLGTRPVLVYAPVIELARRPEQVTPDNSPPTADALNRLPVGSFDKQWVDVSYWVKPDGSVGDVDVIRQSAPNVDAWDAPVLKAIGKRRYLPLHLAASDPGVLRVERYTYTSAFDDTATGTRLRVRDGQPRVEMLDLTQDTTRATAPAAHG